MCSSCPAARSPDCRELQRYMLQRKGRLASPLPDWYHWLVPKMMVAGTGSSSSSATTSPWPAPARVHPNIPLFRGAHAGSMKVLATKVSSKTPAVYVSIASTVAFPGPERRRPTVYYSSSLPAAPAHMRRLRGRGGGGRSGGAGDLLHLLLR